MKDPYEILGVDREAGYEVAEDKYKELKARYSEDRFLTGEAGNEAARKLSELEDAWRQITEEQEKQKAKQNFGGDLGQIDNMIKEGRYDEAQAALDGIADRSAEWHYLQSIIYYKREWMSDCKTQLEMAVNKEPWNGKYRTALDKLNMIMGNPNTDPRTIGVDPNMQMPPQEDGRMCGNACSNCCLAYCLTDCCCSMAQCC